MTFCVEEWATACKVRANFLTFSSLALASEENGYFNITSDSPHPKAPSSLFTRSSGEPGRTGTGSQELIVKFSEVLQVGY